MEKYIAKVGVTFPGQFGDLLWSIPTIREIVKSHGPVDFYTMPLHASILPLLATQDCFNDVFSLESWHLEGRVPGCQPWQHPKLPKEYDREIPLGYNEWPGVPLVNFISNIGKVYLENPMPFIFVEPKGNYDLVTGYSAIYDTQKGEFIDQVVVKVREQKPEFTWFDSSWLPWLESAQYIAGGKVFMGDKSALHVLAHGIGKFVLETESNGDRRSNIFCNPHGQSWMPECTNILQVVDETAQKLIELT